MCGRYTLKSRAEQVAELFGVEVPSTLPERFNIAPSQLVLAVREKPGGHSRGAASGRELVPLKWGLVPFWADDPEIGNRMINARSETAATKPAFRSSFWARRCLIVADGFYEWQARDGKKQPYFIQLETGEPFGFGGLWDRWDKQGEPIETCTILTCNATEPMRVIHDRMPVVIPPARFAEWLDPTNHDIEKLTRLLRPLHPDDMTASPVSTFVNSVKHDSAKCQEPLSLDTGNVSDSAT